MKKIKRTKSSYILDDAKEAKKSAYIKDLAVTQDNDDPGGQTDKERRTDSKIIKQRAERQIEQKTKKSERFIREKVQGSAASSYFLDSVEETKDFLKERRKFTAIYFSALSFILCVAIVFITVFSVRTAKEQAVLNRRSSILHELSGKLDEANRKYLSDVLKNPSVYYALSSQQNTYFEKYLFNYTFSINFGNSPKTTYTRFTSPLNVFEASGGSDVIIEISELYSPVAIKYLNPETLRLFSLFVSPIKAEDGSPVLRDYRTFLTLWSANGYRDSDSEPPNYTISVETNVTDYGNIYIIKLNGFLASRSSAVPILDFGMNFDTSNNPRNLTTLMPVVDGKDIPALELASGSLPETEQIVFFLNSFGGSVQLSDFYDYTDTSKPRITYAIFKQLISRAVGSGGILGRDGIYNGNNRLYLELLLDGGIAELKDAGVLYIKQLLNDALSVMPVNSVQIQAIAQKSANVTLSATEKRLAALAQSADIINKAFGINYCVIDADRAVLEELAAEYTQGYELSSVEQGALTRLLALYDDEAHAEISMVFYMLNSVVKPFDFTSKMALSSFQVRKQLEEN